MAEYVYVEEQTISPGKAALLQDSLPCTRGYIVHENGSGNITMRGIVNNPCAKYAKYKVGFEADIAVPSTGTAGEISVAIALEGEVIPATIATVTPTATEAYFHVSGQKTINVMNGLFESVSIENNSDQNILMQHMNVTINRLA